MNKKKLSRSSSLQSSVTSVLAALLCILIGLLVGFLVRWAPSAVWRISCPRCRPGTLKSAWPVQAFWHWQL